MDSEQRRRYQASIISNYYPKTSFLDHTAMTDGTDGLDLMDVFHSGKVFIVHKHKRNGLIIFKQYHAEFAGPGAMAGGDYDRDCQWVIPIGKLSLLPPKSYEECRDAYLTRREWIRLIQKVTEEPSGYRRTQNMINKFEQWFSPELVAQLPDIVFTMLVGVLPQTVAIVRRLGWDLDNLD